MRFYRRINTSVLVLPLILLLACSFLTAAQRSCFLILQDNVDSATKVHDFVAAGIQVRQHVPPSVMLVDVPDGVDVNAVGGIKHLHDRAFFLDELNGLGPIAMAAGVQWNRSFLDRVKKSGIGAMADVKSLVASVSLPAPQNFQASLTKNILHASWMPAPGALLYEIQAGMDSTFATLLTVSRTDRLEIDLPIDTAKRQTLYVHVRAIDRPDPQNPQMDLEGPWSDVKGVDAPAFSGPSNLPAPIVTSPVDGYQTVGFTAILEWTTSTNAPTRVQVSKTNTFDAPLIDTLIADQEFMIPSSSLHVGDLLTWRVRSWGDNTSPWSNIRTIKINEPRNSASDVFVNPEAAK